MDASIILNMPKERSHRICEKTVSAGLDMTVTFSSSARLEMHNQMCQDYNLVQKQLFFSACALGLKKPETEEIDQKMADSMDEAETKE